MNQDTVQVLVFRRNQKKEMENLFLKRIPQKGRFWQPITGRKEQRESPRDRALRELQEELGIPLKQLLKLDVFANGQKEGKEFVFAAEINYSTEIRLNKSPSAEHDHYQWCTLQEARTLAY